ncbi:ribosomal large subunit pseudouridine synthase E [mine drainage metagenome]|uniref:Ribosomal large subunit pseudouridine synthase E n=1 Tax=mine drainage metagenome TaxID=410659 RepID=A0A1J5TLC8_9ZZZZ
MSKTKHRYFILHKPYNMVSQFISPDKVGLLGDIDFDFPAGTHAVGRLDNHSEGLLILTTNKKVTKLLFESKIPHQRTYLVQVKNVVTEASIEQLKKGVGIKIKRGENYITAPCEASIVQRPSNIAIIETEIKKHHPHTWLMITVTEGKFHQIRKMVAAVKHRCNRLIRLSIEDLSLDNLQPGRVKEIDEEEFFKKLHIDNWK